MEFERSLFRIYERVLTSQNLALWTKIVSICFFTLSILSLCSLFFLHIGYINNTKILSKAISSQLLNGSSIYRSPEYNLTLNLDFSVNVHNTTLMAEDIYNISIGSVSYQYSQFYQILFLPYEVKQRLQIQEHNITLRYEDIMPKYLWPLLIIYNELDTVVINQVGGVFKGQTGTIKNLGSKEIWGWKEKDYEKLSYPGFATRIYVLFWSFFCFCLVSLVTGLICRLAIAGSAGIMISLSWCMTLFRANENTRMILFFSFPWAGQPAYTLRNSGKGIFSLVLSFFLTLFVFYFMYACTNLLWTPMILGYTYPYGLDEKIFTLFSLFEFYSLIFIRSKKSVLWFPRITALLLCSLFIYRRNNFYPFMSAYFYFVAFACFGSMILLIALVEKPIFAHEGPSFESPRLVYQPVFTRNNTALPEIWSTFYPVAGRGAFTEGQMASIYPRQGPI